MRTKKILQKIWRGIFTIAAIAGFAVIGLVAWGFARNPEGTIVTIGFITNWAIQPFLPEDAPRPNEELVDGVFENSVNPARDQIGGIPLTPNFKIIFQEEDHVALLGDGHTAVIAQLEVNGSVDFLHSIGVEDWEWMLIQDHDISKLVKKLTDWSGPDEAEQEVKQAISPIFEDPKAVFMINRLQRFGGTLTNLEMVFASPKHRKFLEWSFDT